MKIKKIDRTIWKKIQDEQILTGAEYIRSYNEMRSHRSGSGALEKIKKAHEASKRLARAYGRPEPKHEFLDKLALQERRNRERAILARKMAIEDWQRFKSEIQARVGRIKERRVEVKAKKRELRRRNKVVARAISRKKRKK